MKKIFPFAALSLILVACQNNKAQNLNDMCNTSNVTYSSIITSMINTSGCLSCHGGPSPIAGFNLETYDQVKAKASETRNGTSVLYGALSHMNGFTPMPQGLPQLNSCTIAQVKAWIDAGMPQ